MTTQTIEVTGRRINPDEVALIVAGQEFRGWTDVRVTRGIERMPSDFALSLTEIYPNAQQFLQIEPGQECELWAGRDRIITGYIDRFRPSIAARSHTVAVSGRGMGCDLVDCMAEWQGQQIIATSVLEAARKLAAPFGVSVNGEAGPAVGGGNSVLIPQFVLMIGETPWEIIERLCRIAGLLAFDQPDGSLRLAENPATLLAGAVQTQKGFAAASSGFTEGVNVKHGAATFSTDQRFSHYRAYRQSWDQWKEFGEGPNLLAEYKEEGIKRYRPRAILMELGKAMAEQNAAKRALWEAKRRWGRSQSVTITTDSWRDSAGALYAPNTLAPLDLPSLKIVGKDWLIADVTYRLSASGTECELQLMPTSAFDVQPTLPPYLFDVGVSQLPAGIARP